jgi:hypothetical protein
MAASAAVAPVRAAVMRVPSMTARGVPSAGSNNASSSSRSSRPVTSASLSTSTSVMRAAYPPAPGPIGHDLGHGE